MDSNKVAFIICVNNNRMYHEAEIYIKSLDIPTGFTLEIIPIYNAKSMTSGYNCGMKKTDAKYKIYLHQDIFIINKYLIQDILNIFSNKKIGMIGLAGSEDIPANGKWWCAINRLGKVIHLFEDYSFFENIFGIRNEPFSKVKLIDGMLIATQYDIKWREDLFDGWHFYDVSQSMEFIKNNYYVVVPNVDKSWVMHACGDKEIDENYYKYCECFLKEYVDII